MGLYIIRTFNGNFSIFIITKGFNWGLDFTGGVVFDTHFSQSANLEQIRSKLHENGIESPVVQTTGSVQDVMIRLPASNNDSTIGEHVKSMLQNVDKDIQIRSIEFVGPNVGEELAQGAVYATLATLAMVLIYVGSRFEWRLGFGSIASLAHDVIITLGYSLHYKLKLILLLSQRFYLWWVTPSTIVLWYLTEFVKISEKLDDWIRLILLIFL